MTKLIMEGSQNFRCQISEKNREILRCVQKKKKEKKKRKKKLTPRVSLSRAKKKKVTLRAS